MTIPLFPQKDQLSQSKSQITTCTTPVPIPTCYAVLYRGLRFAVHCVHCHPAHVLEYFLLRMLHRRHARVVGQVQDLGQLSYLDLGCQLSVALMVSGSKSSVNTYKVQQQQVSDYPPHNIRW